MKKYLPFLIIFVFAIGTLTTYLVYEKRVGKSFPSFYIQKKAGDENQIKQLVLHGTYTQQYRNEDVRLDKQGSKYNRDDSYLKRIQESNDPTITRRQKAYHGFMRGKVLDGDQYFEDKNSLIYANVDWYSGYDVNTKMEIAVLHKKTKQKSAFQVAIPDILQYDFMSIYRIHYAHDKLYVITNNEPADGEKSTEVHIYEIDLNTQKLVDDRHVQLKRQPQTPDMFTNSGVVQQEKKNEDTIVFSQETFKSGNEEDELVASELFSYNLKSKAVKQFKLPKKLQKKTDAVLQEGSSLYLTKQTADEITVYNFDLKTEKIIHEQTFPLNSENGEADIVVELRNNNIYMVNNVMDAKTNADILIADVNNGKTLYKGVLKVKGNKKLTDDQSLRLDYMQIGDDK